MPNPVAICINKLLDHNPIKTSAPCRIDSGGTWDIKAFALRTSVRLLPYKRGWVKISSDNFESSESYQASSAPFNSRFGIFFALISFYNFHGLELVIESTSPVKAGLGGSSTAVVATWEESQLMITTFSISLIIWKMP